MTRNGKVIFGLIIFFCASLVAYNLIRDRAIKRFFKDYQPPLTTISTVKAKLVDWHPTLGAVGTLAAQHGVDVNSDTSGKVKIIHFKSGQFVKKGEPLITIDDKVEQAQLKYNIAELKLKKLSYNRQVSLRKKGATPSSDVDEALANLEKTQANVEQIKAQIQHKHIVAPFSGKLGIRLVDLGQYITPGETSIVTLQSLDPLFLEFYLPEQKSKKVYVGQPVRFQIVEYPDFVFTGTITAINAKVDINTHNIKVQATVPNCPTKALKTPLKSKMVKARKDRVNNQVIVTCQPKLNEQESNIEHSFIPGMFASIKIGLPVVPKQIVLPATAIAYSLFGDSVYVVKKAPKKKDNIQSELYVQQIFVRTGDQRGNEIVITQGIKPGDEVVSSGQLKLQNGTRVEINNKIKMPVVKNIDQLGQ